MSSERRDTWGGRPVARSVADVAARRRVVLAARVVAVRRTCWRSMPVLAVDVDDGSGRITAVFNGRDHVPGLAPGHPCRMEGTALPDGSGFVLWNPAVAPWPGYADGAGGDGAP